MRKGDLKTKDFLVNLCESLGHKDTAHIFVKKFCAENWLNRVDDLRYIPRARLEKWGVPLKLVHELYDTLDDIDAENVVNGVSGFINYSVRPTLSSAYSTVMGGEDETLREQQPEEWAARTLQGKWRWRRAQQHLHGEVQDQDVSEDEPCDFQRSTEREAEELRRKRAEEKIRRMIRRWKYRKVVDQVMERSRLSRGSRGSCQRSLDSMPFVLGGGPLVEPLIKAWKKSGGVLHECEVTSFMRLIGRELRRDEDELALHIHRLVTVNWLEEIDDLNLVEDHHWGEWDFPEHLVMRIKAEVAERSQRSSCASVAGFFALIGGTLSALMSGGHSDSEDSDHVVEGPARPAALPRGSAVSESS